MTASQKSFKSKSICLLILMVFASALILVSEQLAQASSPFDNGYGQGESDAKAGMDRNNTCPSEYDHGACVLYEQGYNLGYTAEKSIHDNDQPRNDYNFPTNDNNGGGIQEDDGEFEDDNSNSNGNNNDGD